MVKLSMYDLGPLEYEKILNIISKYAISESGKKKILGLKPVSDRSLIELELKKIKEIDRLSNYSIDFVPPLINDVYPLLKKVSIINNYIEPFELDKIRQNIKSFISLRKIIKPYSRECVLLGGLFKSIDPLYDLVDLINRFVDDQGNLRDDASEKLISIDGKIKSLKRNIEKTLKNYFSSPETKDFIQEPTITIKNDRYVIPLKHSYISKIPGVVHAHSGSDQTVFIEPFTITEKNNEIKILEKEREKEIRRILKECSSYVHKKENELKLIQDILVEVDFIHSKLKFMKEYRAILPEFSNKRIISLKNGRHPLIQGEVVPLNIKIDENYSAVVVTGPNTGGKTVLLKTIGLFVCMSQSALPIPAEYFITPVFKDVFAEIGDEQSIEQSLSTFSAHISHIKEIIDTVSDKSIVLIDELGAGTDPIEGGAIGTAILDFMRERDILTIVTTHLSMIKMYALEHSDVLVASVQFNPKTLKPTYRVVLGIPGRSNAIEIAETLGLQRNILDKTKLYMGEENRSFDNILKRLSELELNLSERESDITKKHREMEEKLKDFHAKRKTLDEKEVFFKSRFEREVEELLKTYRKKLEEAIHHVIKNRASKESIKKAKKTIEDTENFFEEYENELFSKNYVEKKEINVGMEVKVKTPAGKWVKGSIIEINKNKVTVRTGLLKMIVSLNDIKPIQDEKNELKNKSEKRSSGTNDIQNYDIETTSPALTRCDIRGKRFEEAIIEVERFLDKAILGNIDKVYIIHGLGTGVLREGVWNYLKSCNFVSRYYYARPEEGGFGCTIVELKM